MGYFILSEFDELERCGAFWLSRLSLTTHAVVGNGSRLKSELKRSGENVIDLGEVRVGEEGKKCRLVAVRAQPAVVAARRADRRKKARERGSRPSPDGLVRARWLASDADKFACGPGDGEAARGGVSRAMGGGSAVPYLEAVTEPLPIAPSPEQHGSSPRAGAGGDDRSPARERIAARIGEESRRGRLSFEKLYDGLASHLARSRSLAETDGFEPDLRHVGRDIRVRQSHVESGIMALA